MAPELGVDRQLTPPPPVTSNPHIEFIQGFEFRIDRLSGDLEIASGAVEGSLRIRSEGFGGFGAVKVGGKITQFVVDGIGYNCAP